MHQILPKAWRDLYKVKESLWEDSMSCIRVAESDDFQNIDKCQNIQYVHSAVHENDYDRITVCELPEECSISYGSVQYILMEDLSMLLNCVFTENALCRQKKKLSFSYIRCS
ncbi:hypothetical protein AVEN_38715-1 [Araneus ventricosus]|uniref:Uncharacterized protein n=1 Tax=Araneus ventricosus TaxID=182803 RepID=A0A4Y2IB14_ARAVE|nr:hypothetical protein AVEN_38715-1 [Araneus ventricosus]